MPVSWAESGVSSMTLPISLMTMFSGRMPISWASLAWVWSIRCSPWTGMKNLGFNQGVDDLQLLLAGVAGDVEGPDLS